MEIPSRCRAHTCGEEAVSPGSGPNQALPREEGCQKRATASDRKMPSFIAPQLCTSVDRPPAGGDWVHEIKFDGYRIQMRVESGDVTLKTRKGLDWTAKFGAIANGRRQAA